MSDFITMDTSSMKQGMKEFDKKLKRTIIRKTLRAGAKVTLPVARSTAPEKTGALKRNLKIRTKRSRRNIILTVGTSANGFGGSTYYGAFVAFGHKIGKRPSSRPQHGLLDYRKSVGPNDWLTKAYESTGPGAVAAMEEMAARLIEDAAGGE